MAKKQIRVTEGQRDRLHDLKGPGESYADAVDRLFEAFDEQQNEQQRA